MDTPESLNALQQSVLASIGNNILLFQRVEFSLKQITPFTDLRKATHALEDFRTRHEWFKDKSLGTLVSSLKVGITDETSNELLAALGRMVENRNRLVHKCVADRYVDISTAETCYASIERLELQAKEALWILDIVDALLVGFMYGILDSFANGTDQYEEFLRLVKKLQSRLSPNLLNEEAEDDTLH